MRVIFVYFSGNLIQALYQFAQTTDDGQINCVNFESGRMLTTRMRNHDSAQNCNQTMQMMTAKSDEVIVSIFYETNGLDVLPWEDRDKLQVLLYTLLAAFEENYLSDLVMRRPSLPRGEGVPLVAACMFATAPSIAHYSPM